MYYTKLCFWKKLLYILSMIVVCCKIVSTEYPFNMKKLETRLSGTIQNRSHNLWIVTSMSSIGWQRQRSLDWILHGFARVSHPKCCTESTHKYCYSPYNGYRENINIDVLITIKVNSHYAQGWLYNFAMWHSIIIVAANSNWWLLWSFIGLSLKTCCIVKLMIIFTNVKL